MRKIYFLFLIFFSVKLFGQTYPPPFDLSGGNYTFTSWAATSAAGTFPANMTFTYSTDPGVAGYINTSDGTGNYNCTYNQTSRTRINGLGVNGFSFIITGNPQYDNCGSSGSASNSRYVGTAVLGLNSTGIYGLTVAWTGRTIATSSRVFVLALQYRIGTAGSWIPVTSNGMYTSGAAGSSATQTSTLPAACDNKANLFIRWIYYQTVDGSGSRPELALDDITVGSAPAGNNLSFDYSASTTASLIPPFISGTLNDASDPASVTGFVTDVKDNGAAILSTDYTITVATDNASVVPVGNVSITKNNGTALIKIVPAAAGYAGLTFTLTKGSFTKTLTTSYAASQSAAANTKWPTGIADASAAIAIDDNYMIIANDETNLLYVYDRNGSGLPVTTFDYNQGNVLGLTDGGPGAYKETDAEAGVRSIATPGRTYWLGSMSNSSSFNDKPNRNRIFAITTSGTGAATTFANAGSYANLRANLISWGDANGYAFSTSAAAGVDPKTIDGFNIEGMVFGPDNTTMYIGFRAPLVPAAGRTKAVIAPIQNFETWFNNGSPAGNPVIGNPIELDLGGRGIRDIIRLSTGSYIIVAGNYAGLPITGMIYKWSGNGTQAPVALPSFNIAGINEEAAMEVFDAGVPSLSKLQLIADAGSTVFYNDGVEAKDLANATYKKFNSEVFQSAIAGVLPVQFTYVHAKVQNNAGVLSWGIEQPVEVNSFDIEFSINGATFNSIGISISSALQNNYEYNFPFTKANTGYYRVKANLSNGNKIYSEIKVIGAAESDEFAIYPNPVSNGTFTVRSNEAGAKQAALYDAGGRLVKRINWSGIYTTVSVAGLQKGNYTLRIILSDQSIRSLPVIIM